jgi:hypothetical protein
MVEASQFKYLDHEGDYVCSKECIIKWATRNAQQKVWFDRTKGSAHPHEDTVSGDTPFLHGFFRSLYEYHVATWLQKNNIKFDFEPFTIKFDGKSYLPDFFLIDYGVFLEVKGKWGVSQKKKLAHFRQTFPHLKLLVIPWTLNKEFYGNE